LSTLACEADAPVLLELVKSPVKSTVTQAAAANRPTTTHRGLLMLDPPIPRHAARCLCGLAPSELLSPPAKRRNYYKAGALVS
jgi:hypothetical protein